MVKPNTIGHLALVARIAKMLETAAAETDRKVKWARVNRAAGILVGVVSDRYQGDAAETAGTIANEVAESLAGVLPADTLNQIVTGLAKRVARGLVEFYGEGRS